MVALVQTQDLHTLVQAYREWAYNMFPRLNSEQIFRRVESLGSSKRVQVHNGCICCFHSLCAAVFECASLSLWLVR